jgi:CBS domain containing-hemolysin-like protein
LLRASPFRPETVSLFTVPPTEAFRLVFWPAIWVLNGLANAADPSTACWRRRAQRAHCGGDQLLVSQSAKASVLESEEAKLVSVFQFGDRRVHE